MYQDNVNQIKQRIMIVKRIIREHQTGEILLADYDFEVGDCVTFLDLNTGILLEIDTHHVTVLEGLQIALEDLRIELTNAYSVINN